MFSRFGSRVHIPRRFVARATASVLFFAAAARAQVSCQDFDPQCQTDGVCQADGTCKSTNLPDTTTCNDGNDCTTGDHCENGSCVGASNVTDGTPCTTSSLGLCAKKAVCLSIPLPGFPSYCAPLNPSDIVICPNSGNKCQPNICDPSTGECTSLTIPCSNPCSTGQCDPSTGECVAGNEGAPCDDGNVCTGDDRCHNGECTGIPEGTLPTPTLGIATPTPGPSPCAGDCSGDGQVTVDEILTMVNIALGNTPPGDCPRGDTNQDGQITVDEILAAVNNALNGCPV